MKRYHAAFFAFTLACAVPLAAAGEGKKYDIEKAVITYENSNTLEKFTKTNRVILSFDAYGMKECRETFDGDRLKESFIGDGTTLWLLIHAKRTAHLLKNANVGIGERFDWNDVPERDKEAGRAKQLPDMMVAGKRCAAFELADESGTTTIAAWNRIVLFKREMPECGCTDNVLKAVKVEENAAIAPEKFQPPAGYAQERD